MEHLLSRPSDERLPHEILTVCGKDTLTIFFNPYKTENMTMKKKRLDLPSTEEPLMTSLVPMRPDRGSEGVKGFLQVIRFPAVFLCSQGEKKCLREMFKCIIAFHFHSPVIFSKAIPLGRSSSVNDENSVFSRIFSDILLPSHLTT
ncbi:hypothetical protein TNCV_3301671 [Trichonephila clavipes]|nr:hypothetical protein TNCV_3301671 [Trichonephila clavipes]